MGHESIIMEQTEIGEISDDIKDCLRQVQNRCARRTCRVPTCSLAAQQDPRHLAADRGLLYEEQTRRGVSLAHWAEFEDVADHCTICHKCEALPVDIDFGDVTVKMRSLAQPGQEILQSGQGRGDGLPHRQDPATIKPDPHRHDRVGLQGAAPRLPHCQIARPDPGPGQRRRRRLLGKAPIASPIVRSQIIHFINKPMPGGLPKRTSRALLDIEDDTVVPVIRDPQKFKEDSDAVFYFPAAARSACSRRSAWPRRRCSTNSAPQPCCHPATCAAATRKRLPARKMPGRRSRDNRVLFHRVANTLNYLDIRTVIVSCGTCMDQLQKYQFEKIFPGCRLLDIHEYLIEKGVHLNGVEGTRHVSRALPHADEPCPGSRSPMN